jgi:hypothetical protein
MTYSDGTDLLPALNFIAPDDGNPNDRTVAEVVLPRPVLPGETATLSLDFRSTLPRVSRRTGYKGDFYLVAQWFPKLGVFEEGGWNCHQFHATSEFFSDFGNYDVSISVPPRYRGKVGATGKQVEERKDAEGRILYRFKQEGVHDFTWTADPNYREGGLLPQAGLRRILRLLVQPEHGGGPDATSRQQAAISTYGRILGLSLRHADDGRSALGSPSGRRHTDADHAGLPERAYFEPQGVTVHEFGHQFFWASWPPTSSRAGLDEGFNSYDRARAGGTTVAVLSVFGWVPLGIDVQHP